MSQRANLRGGKIEKIRNVSCNSAADFYRLIILDLFFKFNSLAGFCYQDEPFGFFNQGELADSLVFDF